MNFMKWNIPFRITHITTSYRFYTINPYPYPRLPFRACFALIPRLFQDFPSVYRVWQEVR